MIDLGTDVTLLDKPKFSTLASEVFNKQLNKNTRKCVLIITFFCFLAQA